MPVRKVIIDKANRLYQMPPDIAAFAETEKKKLFPRKSDLIDLARFHWPIEFESDQLPDQSGLAPADSNQIAELREELADWYNRQHGVRLVSEKQVFIGGGIASIVRHLCLAYVDAGDVAFVPSVGLPLYRSAVVAADGEPISYSISAKTDWSPRFDRLATGLGRVARLLFLNSPHNPTGTDLSEKEMSDLTWLAGRENVLIVNDAAYASISARPPVSLMSVPGGKRVGIEVGSFAYQFGLPSLPLAFAVGNREVISGLKRLARLMPAYVPKFHVELARRAIRKHPSEALQAVRDRVKRAAAESTQLLELLKLQRAGSEAVPYAWARIERRTASTAYAKTLLRRYHLLTVPGIGFGENGEGHLRLCLLNGPEPFAQAASRVKKHRIIKRGGKE